LLTDEPAAEAVEGLLRGGGQARLSVLNEAEVLDVMVRLRGRSVNEVTEKVDWLVAAGLHVVDVSQAIAREAGRIRAAEYHRERRPVSLADCVALATAVVLDDDLATSDPGLAAVADAVGTRVIGLPDAQGRRP
jgi:predicted nucleic acid-binding protein